MHIGDEHLGYDCTVSATVLYLLKTLTENHTIHEENQMLPCCGHFYVPDATLENVMISGCGNGIDWIVNHSGGNVILILENGTEVIVPLEEYQQEVYRFADKIENYYKSCSPKKCRIIDLGVMDILHFGMSGIGGEMIKFSLSGR